MCSNWETKTTQAHNAILKTLATSGNMSIKLTMSLFDSKIEPILTHGSIIWGVENCSNNSIIISGLRENSGKSTHDQVMEQVPTEPGEEIVLETAKKIGRKIKEFKIGLF